MSAGGSRFCLTGRFGTAEISLPLLGDFNVANALAAAACALALGRPLAEVAERLAGAPQVPGRMERISDVPCVVLRDYAHTPDALERALASLRPLTPGRLIVVFGCGGDRDRGKRPLMGAIAGRLADLAIATSDNPRTEDPEAILDDIEQGMAGATHQRIVDRLEAIHAALRAGTQGRHDPARGQGSRGLPDSRHHEGGLRRAGDRAAGGAGRVSVESSRPVIPPWREADVRAALGLARVEGDRRFSTISTDTREIPAGALFVALSGERFDGHDYLAAAAAAGAAAAIVREGTPAVPGLTLLPVPDPLRAFGQLARARRRGVSPVRSWQSRAPMERRARRRCWPRRLGTRYVTYATRANLNNLVGVPLTILEAPAGAEALVVEAGANLPGEIARYREIIEPDVVVVTNAVAGHLEGFGSLAGVLEEKLSLTDGVATAIVGTDPAALAAGARSRARSVRTAGLQGADLVPDRVELGPDARPRLTFGDISFSLGARGLHQADNAVRVWAVAEALNLDRTSVGQALERFQLPSGRGELLQSGGLTILNDCYNANPQSFRSAIATAAALRGKRRLVFVAGTMRELGTASAELHAGDRAGAGGPEPGPARRRGRVRSGAGPARRHTG